MKWHIQQTIYIYINGFVQELRICTCNEKHDDKPWDVSNFPMFRWWRRYLQPASGLIFNTGKGLGVLSNCLGQQCVHWNNPRVDKGLKPRMWSSKTPKPMLPSYSRWSLADGMQNQHWSKILSRKMKFRQDSWSHGILMMIKQGSFGGVVRKMSDTSTSSTRLWVTGRAPRRLQRFHMVLIDVGVPKVVHLKPPFTETTGFDHA